MFNLQKIPKFSRWLMVGLCTCLLSLSVGMAQAAAPFYWDFIHVDITLEADGDLLITETQKYTFTADHTRQRYRYIPLDEIDRITDVAVYEEEVQLPTETGIENNQYWIRWRHDLAAPESHIFKVQYRVIGGVQVRGVNSQIYWRALFPERSAVIKQGKVTVHLPDELVGRVSRFTSDGVTSTQQQTGLNTLEFVAQKPLAPGQFLDVKVPFPTGILDLEEPPKSAPIATNANGGQSTPKAIAPSSSSFLQNDLLVLSLQWLGLMAIVTGVGLTIYLQQRPCPSCGKRGLHRVNRVIRLATTQRKGEKEVGYACSLCDYRQTHREDIAKWPTRSTARPRSRRRYSGGSSYGGYSGGFGGGGSGGGGGGGGGSCGGGASGGGGGG